MHPNWTKLGEKSLASLNFGNATAICDSSY